MRYSKARGYPALLGLGISLLWTPVMLIGLAFLPQRKPT